VVLGIADAFFFPASASTKFMRRHRQAQASDGDTARRDCGAAHAIVWRRWFDRPRREFVAIFALYLVGR